MLCCKYRSSRFDLIPKPYSLIDLLFEVTESVQALPQPYGLTISIF